MQAWSCWSLAPSYFTSSSLPVFSTSISPNSPSSHRQHAYLCSVIVGVGGVSFSKAAPEDFSYFVDGPVLRSFSKAEALCRVERCTIFCTDCSALLCFVWFLVVVGVTRQSLYIYQRNLLHSALVCRPLPLPLFLSSVITQLFFFFFEAVFSLSLLLLSHSPPSFSSLFIVSTCYFSFLFR